MSNHPYPEHVVEAVAEALWRTTDGSFVLEWKEIDDDVRDYQRNKANAALQSLWDASRVDDLHGLPDRAIYVDEHGGVGIVGRARQTGHCDMNQPATILYWGDASE